jgi:hypothetical protein
MPLGIEERDAAFRALSPLFRRYAKMWKGRLSYKAATALGFHAIDIPRSPGFATLFAHPADVRVYFFPLRVWPELARALPASVKKRIVSRSVFVFKDAITSADVKALTALFAAAAAKIEERRKLAPTVSYAKRSKADASKTPAKAQKKMSKKSAAK